jgi:hypothetical protein
MATKKESKDDTADNTTTATTAVTTAVFSDSDIIAVQLKDGVVYPRDGKAEVTAEQMEQLKEMGLVE